MQGRSRAALDGEFQAQKDKADRLLRALAVPPAVADSSSAVELAVTIQWL